MKRKINGFVSVFLALILMPTYMFTIVSLDVARQYSANNYLLMANEAALQSQLLSYDDKLFQKYGLLASNVLDKDDIESIVKSNLEVGRNNLNFNVTRHIESIISGVEDSKLINSKIIEKQILEYMKYRGPIKAVKGILVLLDMAKASNKYNKAVKDKCEYLSNLEKFEKKIKFCEEAFSSYEDNLDRINKLLGEYVSHRNRLIEKNKTDYNGDIGRIIKASKKFNNKYSKLIGLINNNIKCLDDISEYINNIDKQNAPLDLSLKKWEKSIEKIEDIESRKLFESEFKYYPKNYGKKSVDQANKAIYQNLIKHKKLAEIFDEERKWSCQVSDDGEYIFSEIEDSHLSEVDSIANCLIFKDENKSKSRPKISASEKHSAGDSRKALLKLPKDILRIRDTNDTIFSFIEKEKISDIIQYQGQVDDDSSISFKDLEIKDNKSMVKLMDKSEKNKEFNSQITSIDNLFIAEYIGDKFSDVSSQQTGGFNGEKEYILYGLDKLSSNNNRAIRDIFILRLGLNSVYAFTSPEIRRQALALATAIAGWTGIGVPIMESIILTLIVLGESSIDCKNLLDGKKVMAYKSPQSWNLSVRGLANLCKSGIESIAENGVDNIFDNIEQIALEAIDGSFDTIESFIKNRRESVIESIKGAVIIPIQNEITKLIIQPIEGAKSYFDDLFDQLDAMAGEDTSQIMRSIKLKAIEKAREYCASNLDEIISYPHKVANEKIIKYLDELNNYVENYIHGELDAIGDDLKGEVSTIISNNKDDYRDKIKNKLVDFLNPKPFGKQDDIKLAYKGGISFDYKDYLKLISLLKLNSGKKDEILKRMAVVIDIEMNRIEGEFDIRNVYTAFKINSIVNLINIGVDEINDKRKRVFQKQLEMSY